MGNQIDLANTGHGGQSTSQSPAPVDEGANGTHGFYHYLVARSPRDPDDISYSLKWRPRFPSVLTPSLTPICYFLFRLRLTPPSRMPAIFPIDINDMDPTAFLNQHGSDYATHQLVKCFALNSLTFNACLALGQLKLFL